MIEFGAGFGDYDVSPLVTFAFPGFLPVVSAVLRRMRVSLILGVWKVIGSLPLLAVLADRRLWRLKSEPPLVFTRVPVKAAATVDPM